ncbi:hypothetical protein JNJ66_02420 [Candidatus Saccharibacteria bacterium]|nr:hypothetical protein [Candidatus Saccharibacteria bacterium]
MQQFRLFKLLLKPSLFSAVWALLISGLILGIGNWLYAFRSNFASEYLFGTHGLVTGLQQSHGDLIPLMLELFDKPFSYNIIVLLVAIICGALVYLSLESVTRSVDSVHETWEEIHYASGQSRKLVEVELGTRWLIRSLALGGWIGYWITWMSIIIPFSLIATRGVYNDSLDTEGWLYGLLGLLVCALSIHLHVIFIRLTLLRPRVFGGRREIEMESYDAH